MNLVYWSGIATDVIQYASQNLTVGYSANPSHPIGTVMIRGTGTDVLLLPNSTNTSPVWSVIPGTSPALEARQDGHFDSQHILVRSVPGFTNVSSVHASINLGAVAAATRVLDSGVEARFRGFFQATAGIPAGTVLFRVAHPPRHNVSTGVRYTQGSSRLQISTAGDVTLGVALVLNDQVWLDSTTYDLLA